MSNLIKNSKVEDSKSKNWIQYIFRILIVLKLLKKLEKIRKKIDTIEIEGRNLGKDFFLLLKLIKMLLLVVIKILETRIKTMHLSKTWFRLSTKIVTKRVIIP